MAQRITMQHVEAQAQIASDLTGRMVQVYSAYGSYSVHEVYPDQNHAHTDLMGGCIFTKREVSLFLSGMIAACRITDESRG